MINIVNRCYHIIYLSLGSTSHRYAPALCHLFGPVRVGVCGCRIASPYPPAFATPASSRKTRTATQSSVAETSAYYFARAAAAPSRLAASPTASQLLFRTIADAAGATTANAPFAFAAATFIAAAATASAAFATVTAAAAGTTVTTFTPCASFVPSTTATAGHCRRVAAAVAAASADNCYRYE